MFRALGGAILGGAGGGLSGFILGGGNALLSGGNFWDSALTGLWQGAASGAVLGGISGGASASKHNKNFWTGKPNMTSNVSANSAANTSATPKESRPRYAQPGDNIEFPNPDYIEGTKTVTTLDAGTYIDRFSQPLPGRLEGGRYFSDLGVPLSQRSIPYDPKVAHYGLWKLNVPLQVEKSIVAPFPKYGLPGGGVQYRFLHPETNAFMNASQMQKEGFITIIRINF